MDYKVILSPRAIQDLQEIVRYIAWDSPKDAEQFGNRLIDQAQRLKLQLWHTVVSIPP
jgi:toxin ParE1/3/4